MWHSRHSWRLPFVKKVYDLNKQVFFLLASHHCSHLSQQMCTPMHYHNELFQIHYHTVFWEPSSSIRRCQSVLAPWGWTLLSIINREQKKAYLIDVVVHAKSLITWARPGSESWTSTQRQRSGLRTKDSKRCLTHSSLVRWVHGTPKTIACSRLSGLVGSTTGPCSRSYAVVMPFLVVMRCGHRGVGHSPHVFPASSEQPIEAHSHTVFN